MTIPGKDVYNRWSWCIIFLFYFSNILNGFFYYLQKACQGIYPLHDVHIRKVKVMKKPRFDAAKLLELHGEGSGKATTVTTDAATGEIVERPEGYEPPVMETV